MFVCFACVYVCVIHVQGCQKRALYTLELKLKDTVSKIKH